MGRLLKCVIVLLIADSNMLGFRVFGRGMASVAESFVEYEIVEDVIPVAPSALLSVTYTLGDKTYEVNEGNELSPTQTLQAPTVSFQAEPDQFYTLAMIDPDVPSRTAPIFRELRHWLVGNIPGADVSKGETLSAYLAPTPPPGTGLHRYVFLVYKQPGKLSFDEPTLTNVLSAVRTNFSIAKFAEQYNLGVPVAGNFFQAQDAILPILNE